MNREQMLDRLTSDDRTWDMLIIGGGATGVGVAVDAASRGHSVALLEQSDFGKGTSSRSTKLAHGGVRYLQQGNIALVMEALKERGIMRRNAPHLVHDQRFVVPNYDWWAAPFYGAGLKVYDLLAGRYGFGPSRILSRDRTLELLPTIRTDGLRGGVQYYDGQFDDARLLINLVTTAAEQGAVLANYVRVVGLTRDGGGLVDGARVHDLESGREHEVRARVVVNATGPFVDAVRRLDDATAPLMIAPSRGSHLVLDRSFLPGDNAIMVPHTKDGRVMFAIPWHDRALVGTTDVATERPDLEPRATDAEIDFILDTAHDYLERPPRREDVRSVFAGIRPLVRADEETSTAELSRDHTIHVAASGLVTICGGKWTTYRNMAEDCVDRAATVGGLDERPCVTRDLNIHAYHRHAEQFGDLEVYGADALDIRALQGAEPALAEPLHADLPYTKAEVAWAVRREMARTVEDVLSRRTRALLLDARAAKAAASDTAAVMAAELGRDASWRRSEVERFEALADGYIVA